MKNENNARFHLLASVVIILGALALGIHPFEWTACLLAMGIVWAAEGANAAIEELSDTLHPKKAAGIRNVKDLAAGAVLLASIFAALVALIIFVPKIVSLF